MVRLPILRSGDPYYSLDEVELADVRSGEPVARVSQANPGLIARDLARDAERRAALREMGTAEWIGVCRRAAAAFVGDDLPVDPARGIRQSPADYRACLSATTGMPLTLVRANMEKTRYVLAEMETVLGGLTRGLGLEVLDRGYALQDGRTVSYLPLARSLGCVLPSNSPGVHSLWLPAVALRVPLALKPGRQEPWTPLRIGQALLAAGCPPQAIGFYPASNAGATELLLRTDRSMLFGDAGTVRPWANDPRVQLHGPGYSKVVFGRDRVDDWERCLELLVESVASNGGRSCLNASGIRVPAHGRALAEALAERLAGIEARPLDDPRATLAAFSDPAVARRISDQIDAHLAAGGAEDLTLRHRGTPRLVECDGCTFLLPTVVWCEDPEHALAQAEYLFPFVSVVEVPHAEQLARLGPTLVATAITDDAPFTSELLECPSIDRLNLGAVPTSRVAWDQPHEGNLFEHLYRQRAVQVGGGGTAIAPAAHAHDRSSPEA